jgi:anaerobic ribonucleoside-triphosphate reductase activating protein
MLKYVDTKVTFAEVPDEISLCINISNCPIHCVHCHSKYLWEDIGEPLHLQHLIDLIDANTGITCVCVMGGDGSIEDIDSILEDIKNYYPNLKTAWYSGRFSLPKEINIDNLDYVKIGPYIAIYGDLSNKETNQTFKKKVFNGNNYEWVDITYMFQK